MERLFPSEGCGKKSVVGRSLSFGLVLLVYVCFCAQIMSYKDTDHIEFRVHPNDLIST